MRNVPGINMRIATALLIVGVALAACSDSPSEPQLGVCGAVVNLFPTPVTNASSGFAEVDDDFLAVPFASGFQFTFYGTQYSSVFLNTNGGMTFGAGEWDYDMAAVNVTQPGIAVFWGDLDASEYGADVRANQMSYEACEDRFIVRYAQLQDNDDATWNNTATVTLRADGEIVIVYGAVLSEDILAGVFDGTHTNDQYPALQANYASYDGSGTGIILFDYWGQGPDHMGELSSRTITFDPAAPAAVASVGGPSGALPPMDRPSDRGTKGPKR